MISANTAVNTRIREFPFADTWARNLPSNVDVLNDRVKDAAEFHTRACDRSVHSLENAAW